MRTEPDDEYPATERNSLFGAWGAVLRDVRTLAADLTTAGTEIARQLPLPDLHSLAELGDAGRIRVEEAVLRELKNRMNAVDAGTRTPRDPDGNGIGPARPYTPGQLLDALLEASLEADSSASRDELYLALLGQLVPDEARILAALSDGSVYPLLHVQTRSGGGATVLANASTVGRAAGVQLPDSVSAYVHHLRTLGLAEDGPADDSLAVQYDILAGESVVRRAEQQAKEAGRLGARMVRRTLRISALGRELWLACRPEQQHHLGELPVLAPPSTNGSGPTH